MKQRIIVITVTILICLAALPTILSYHVRKTFNLYSLLPLTCIHSGAQAG